MLRIGLSGILPWPEGSADAPALEMTKWFNTNYHYLVPELEKNLEFSLDSTKILEEYKEARILGIKPIINILGPVTFLSVIQSYSR